MTENRSNVIDKIPSILEKTDNRTRASLIKLQKNNTIISLQYNGPVDISDDDLLDAIQNSIQFYEFSLMDFVYVFKGFVTPRDDDRIKCVEMTINEAINRKLLLTEDINKQKKSKDIHFIAFTQLPNEKIYSKSFFGDIQLNFSPSEIEDILETLKKFSLNQM